MNTVWEHPFYYYWAIVNMFLIALYLIYEMCLLFFPFESCLIYDIETRFIIANFLIFGSLMILAIYLGIIQIKKLEKKELIE